MKSLASRFLVVPAFLLPFAYEAGARSVVSLDADWRFYQGEVENAEVPAFDDAGWETVDVPHDWCIAGEFSEDAPSGGPGGWLPSGVCYYRKTLEVPADAEGHQMWVEFDGIMANSDVWLNGELLGHRPCGYSSFRYDITDKVKCGEENLLVVKADTSLQPASRWYTGCGIYRHVRLVIAAPVHVAPWGVYVTTPEVNTKTATVKVEVALANATDKLRKVTVRARVEDAGGAVVAQADAKAGVLINKPVAATLALQVETPQLWNLETPNMYTLVTEVLYGSDVIDEVRTPFGIRTAEFLSETGFWLNGKNIKLKGVCLHHDGGAVGAAVPLAVWERRFKRLKALGVNAIRTAHNPPAPDFLDLCDRMGFLVMDEFFDVWRKGKHGADRSVLHDYHLYFDEWSHTDLREGILRDRNHPSVILYSLGNEIHDTPNEKQAKEILSGLVKICHELDPSRPTTQGLFRPNQSHDYDNGLADMLDVIGTNYRYDELLQAWEDKPGRKIVMTESRHDRPSWVWVRDHAPFSGLFLWPGIDYLGESSSWPLTVFNNGLLDRCGFIMPRGREHQSWWSDKPMVAAFRRTGATVENPGDPGYETVEWKRSQVLYPDWNPDAVEAHEENVEVYSNAEEVELLLNGISLGRKATRADAGALNWNVVYETGALEAVAYNGGKEVARDTLRTAGESAAVRLVPDRTSLGLGFDDVVTVEVELVDEDGIVVPKAFDLVTFSVSGPGEIIAVDNGNVFSTEPFAAAERKAYQGRCIAVVRATGEGTIELSAQVEGLEKSVVALFAK